MFDRWKNRCEALEPVASAIASLGSNRQEFGAEEREKFTGTRLDCATAVPYSANMGRHVACRPPVSFS